MAPIQAGRRDADASRPIVALLYFVSLTCLGTMGVFLLKGAPRFELPGARPRVVDAAPDLPVARAAFGPVGSIAGFNGTYARREPSSTAAPAAAAAAKAAPRAAAPKASSLTHAVGDLAPRFGALWRKYRARHPVIAEYEREWMSDPELRALRDDFMRRGRDPVRFVHGLTRSQAFVRLFSKYAGQEPFRALAKEAIALTPTHVLIEASSQASQDRVVLDFASSLAGAAGYALPAKYAVDPALAERLIRQSRKAR